MYGKVQVTDKSRVEFKVLDRQAAFLERSVFRYETSFEIQVFSDALDTGYGGFISENVHQNGSGRWSYSESAISSTRQELKAGNRSHHIEIFRPHRKDLGFYWNSKYFVFNVLPFGISTLHFHSCLHFH